MLDPSSALGRTGHAAGEDLLRGIIEICLAVPRNKDGLPGADQPGGGFGGMGGAGDNDEPIFQWRDTTLVRKLADEKSARILLDWMLAELDERGSAVEEEEEDAGRTPKPPSTIPLPESTNGLDDEMDPEQVRRDMRTSSLVSALSVFIELIRKNNSDFVEQHMLAWARRKQADHLEREMLEAEGAQVVLDSRHAEQDRPDDKGPSVVDLSALLSSVAQRLDGFQKLLKEPRSLVRHDPTFQARQAEVYSRRPRLSRPLAESALPSPSSVSAFASSTRSFCTAPTCRSSIGRKDRLCSTTKTATSLAAGRPPTNSPPRSPAPQSTTTKTIWTSHGHLLVLKSTPSPPTSRQARTTTPTALTPASPRLLVASLSTRSLAAS